MGGPYCSMSCQLTSESLTFRSQVKRFGLRCARIHILPVKRHCRTRALELHVHPLDPTVVSTYFLEESSVAHNMRRRDLSHLLSLYDRHLRTVLRLSCLDKVIMRAELLL